MYDKHMAQTSDLAAARATIVAAREAAGAVRHLAWQHSGDELGAVVRELDDLDRAVRAAIVAVTAEAIRQGGISASQCRDSVSWLREHAPSLRQGGSRAVADCAAVVAAERGGRGLALHQPAHNEPAEPPTPVEVVCEAVLSGELGAPTAVTVLAEFDRLRSRLRPEAHSTVAVALTQLGREWGGAQVRRLRPSLLAEHGLPGELQADHDTLARAVCLSTPAVEDGLTTYRLTLDPESAATLEAAIGTLSAPCPDPVTGARDPRPASRRRAQALIEVCRRATAAGERLPNSGKAALIVTVGWETLRSALHGAGTVVGTTATGTLMAPETVRRLACDAEIIPAVLGSGGELLDLGTSVRFFARAQTRALWVRDGGCSFPGCGTPAHWCHAHHLVHWADGGATDLANAALLCHRHHDIVHRDRLRGEVHDPPDAIGDRAVHWDLSPGSYDRAIRGRPAA
jgi:hypothetical protein